ncbi:restriction endonuclease subunit S [Methanoplanus endosymbiosus]|uniref:Restriction endonuclease subunit S n=1 Tax=Methanoplanus endosymbiosus TaxID=33865 RepID=A0A9E7PRI2_9EURY|nr:restriction endonuclease subunit S [Methanoplanus endosymbiosus]UUX93804.1 restriction endonuclease subunit S [Methanoplanus endosymbiosus]
MTHTTRLKDIASLNLGRPFRRKLEHDSSGTVCIIQNRDILPDSTIDYNNCLRLSPFDVSDKHRVNKGDILFRSRGPDTCSAIIEEETEEAVFASPLMKIEVNDREQVLPEYLNWFLNQRPSQAYYANNRRGSVVMMISISTLSELPVFIPELKKQKGFVEFSELIKRERRTSEKLSEKREKISLAILERTMKGEA